MSKPIRTHSEIAQSRHHTKLAEIALASGLPVSPSAPRQWAARDSIPAEYWYALARAKVASLTELAAYAEHRLREQGRVAGQREQAASSL